MGPWQMRRLRQRPLPFLELNGVSYDSAADDEIYLAMWDVAERTLDKAQLAELLRKL